MAFFHALLADWAASLALTVGAVAGVWASAYRSLHHRRFSLVEGFTLLGLALLAIAGTPMATIVALDSPVSLFEALVQIAAVAAWMSIWTAHVDIALAS